MAENVQNNEVQQDLNEILKVRREKLQTLQNEGHDPFVETKYVVSHYAADIKENFDANEKTDAKTSKATVIRGEEGINLILISDEPLPRLGIAIKSQNLISEDMTFRPLTAEDEGLEVFVSYEAKDGMITVFAIYDHSPR